MRRSNNPPPNRKTGKLGKAPVPFGHHFELPKAQQKTTFGSALNSLNDIIDSYSNIDKPLSAIDDQKRYNMISDAIRKNKLILFEQYVQQDKEAVISASNTSLSKPLIHLASQNPNPLYLDRLLQLGISPNQLDENLNTPAFHCTDYLDHILLLHKAGCNLNAKNKHGETILHILMSQSADLTLFYKYVECGCDPTIKNSQNIVPLNLVKDMTSLKEILIAFRWYKSKKILFLKKYHASILERIPLGIIRNIIDYL